MANAIVHAAERKAFELVLSQVIKTAGKDGGYLKVIDMAQKFLGDTWAPEAFEKLRTNFGKGQKWANFFDRVLQNIDPDVLKGMFLSFGFEMGYVGYHETRKNAEKYGVNVPWVILFDPTSACNLRCKGCWAAEYSHQLNLSFEDMDRIVTEGKALGTHGYVMTGGEPTIRRDDIFRLAKKHKDCGFMIFTNGTLVDQSFCDEIKACKNILLSLSIEGLETATDSRRGDGVFDKVMATMDLLRENRLPYGTSICYTSQNYQAVTSDEFYDFLIEKGVLFSWYFHFMPTGNNTTMDLVPTPEQREYMYHRVREIRGFEGGKEIFLMDFQNDGEWVSGCIAGGKAYCHINPAGDVEPCVFIHYSGANIHDKSLLECLQQPLFRAYHDGQPFSDNLLRPCPMLENPAKLYKMVHDTGAKSTDMQDPEEVDHLARKVEQYAKDWAPVAEKLWASDHPDYRQKEESEIEGVVF